MKSGFKLPFEKILSVVFCPTCLFVAGLLIDSGWFTISNFIFWCHCCMFTQSFDMFLSSVELHAFSKIISVWIRTAKQLWNMFYATTVIVLSAHEQKHLLPSGGGRLFSRMRPPLSLRYSCHQETGLLPRGSIIMQRLSSPSSDKAKWQSVNETLNERQAEETMTRFTALI